MDTNINSFETLATWSGIGDAFKIGHQVERPGHYATVDRNSCRKEQLFIYDKDVD